MNYRVCLRVSRSVGIIAITGLLIIEVILRVAGYGDFPLFDIDTEIGYIPKPSQAGVFTGEKDWVLNERSMLNYDSFKADRHNGVLVLGDSIVWGGVAYKHAEKIGPCVQVALGAPWHVWSVGAGSWAVLNELTYLERNMEVVEGVTHIVWLINSADWGARSQWTSGLTHPTVRPLWLGGYFGLKFLSQRGWFLKQSLEAPRLDTPQLGGEAQRGLIDFCRASQSLEGPRGSLKVTLVYYPSLAELGVPSAQNSVATALAVVARETGVCFYDLRTHPLWDSTAYKDSIHPTSGGNRRLATILKELVLSQ